jgi:hypothetical protein
MRTPAALIVMLTSCAALPPSETPVRECTSVLQQLASAGAHQTQDQEDSGIREVKFESSRNGAPATRSISCRGETVVSDTGEVQFASPESAQSLYDALRTALQADCGTKLTDQEEYPYGDMGPPPGLSDNAVYSVHSTPVLGAVCVEEGSSRTLLVSRFDSIDDRKGRETNWVVIEGFQLDQ